MVEMSDEQVAELQEKIKNMSPEELKEFQKKQCIFCHIAAGQVASRKIYEDDKCVAVLDINPANPGHMLLMPKEHYPIMPMIPEDEISHIFMVAKALSHVFLKALKAEGTTIFIANGISAGQRAQHFMVHLIPRKEKDGLVNLDIPKKLISLGKTDAIKKALAEQVARVFKLEKKIIKEEKSPEEKIVEKKSEEEIIKKQAKEEKPSKKQKKIAEEKKSNKVSLDDIAGLFK